MIFSAGCRSLFTPQRAFLVLNADVEYELAAPACVEVVRTLGEARAKTLLEGHVIRRGEKLVIAIREWNDGREMPSLRVTAAVDPYFHGTEKMPNAEVTIAATRASADGARAKRLTIDRGEIRVRRDSKVYDIGLELYFKENDEPPVRMHGQLPVLDLYSLDPCGGRAVAAARPEEYLKP
ncbi:MAG: hypothetical protein HY286_06930 [Planctomycetes bacterium]|nr:hypothetical protein [Planctomycetota bacterium]